MKENKVWIEYTSIYEAKCIFNEAKPTESTLRCKVCSKYYDKLNLPLRYKNAFARGEGTLKDTKGRNKEAIAEHPKCPGHIHIIQLLEKAAAKRFGMNFL